jgi:hypothetical protein
MNLTTRRGWFYEISILTVFFGALLSVITLGIFGSQWEYVLYHMDLPIGGFFTPAFILLGLLWIVFGFLLFRTAMKLSGSLYSSLSPKFLLFETFMEDSRTAKNVLILAFVGMIVMYVWSEFIFLTLKASNIISSGLCGVLSLVALLGALVIMLLNLGAYIQMISVEMEV